MPMIFSLYRDISRVYEKQMIVPEAAAQWWSDKFLL